MYFKIWLDNFNRFRVGIDLYFIRVWFSEDNKFNLEKVGYL